MKIHNIQRIGRRIFYGVGRGTHGSASGAMGRGENRAPNKGATPDGTSHGSAGVKGGHERSALSNSER